MRVSSIAGAAMIFAMAGFTMRATARPLKIDYHASICQKTNTGATVTYRTDGISVASASSVVCPLEQVTFSTDTVGTAQITFKAWVQAKDTGAQDSACQLVSAGSTFASIPSFPSSLTAESGTVMGTGIFSVPTTTDSTPTELHVACDFEGSAFLGTMQVKMIDH